MKSSGVVLFALLFVMNGSAQTAMPELLDAQYRGNTELSKLTFVFSEPVRFLQKRIGASQIRLTFPNTNSATYANRVPLIFKSGHAKTLSFDCRRSDTMAVIIRLNENVEYDVRKPHGKPLIVVDMYSREMARIPAVDLASLVKQQIDDANATEKANAKPVPSRGFFDIQFVPFVASLLISLLGTAGMMYWIVKPTPPTRIAPERAVLPGRTAVPSGVDAILDQARIILREKCAQSGGAHGADGRHDVMTTLARRFGRGQGEFHLARRMEGKDREYLWEKKLQGLDMQQRDSLARAKKLRVGRGELELAALLKKMDQNQVRKEPLT